MLRVYNYAFGSGSLLGQAWTEPTEPVPMVRFKVQWFFGPNWTRGCQDKKRHLGSNFFFSSSERSTYLLCNQAHYLYMVIMTLSSGMFPSPTLLEDKQALQTQFFGICLRISHSKWYQSRLSEVQTPNVQVQVQIQVDLDLNYRSRSNWWVDQTQTEPRHK